MALRATGTGGADHRSEAPVPDDELGEIRHGDEHRDMPTMDQPLNARKRPVWKPLILLVAFIAALVLIYLFGLAVLVPSD